jgi:hypothetical protein
MIDPPSRCPHSNVDLNLNPALTSYIVLLYRADGKEDRPYLTVKPLAESLEQYGVPFNFTIDRDHVDKVKDAVHDYIKGKGKDEFQGSEGNVLICWEHDTLEKIAAVLGVEQVPEYPGKR